jgi:glycerol-3-phosphate dehydrogenase
LKRASLDALCEEHFDILVVGGGIYGLMAARDAAMRGLRTALVERDDFGGATSHNSLKLMHGGIRYVQHLDFARLRASARERAFWQRAAPTLVKPLEFTIPLIGRGIKGPAAFAAAVLLYNAASAGVRGPSYRGARVISARAARRSLGELTPEGLTGGGVWLDGQLQDVARLHIAILQSVTDAAGLAANYMNVRELTSADGRVTGARLHDRLTGAEGEIRARMTLSCTGATAARLAAPHLGDRVAYPDFLRATNLLVDRKIGDGGLGVVSQSRADAVVDRGGRMYFLTPWQGRTLIGTHEAPGQDSPSSDTDIADFLDQLNQACPTLGLGRGDVVWSYQGLIPANVDDARGSAQRLTRTTLIDHTVEGLGGLISVTGVKYTTARLMAERAVDRAMHQLGRAAVPSESYTQDLPVDHAVDPDPRTCSIETLAARLRQAVRNEMAASLEDVTTRRTLWAETGLLQHTATMKRIRQAAQVAGLPTVAGD